jgi:methylthioxylose transferase
VKAGGARSLPGAGGCVEFSPHCTAQTCSDPETIKPRPAGCRNVSVPHGHEQTSRASHAHAKIDRMIQKLQVVAIFLLQAVLIVVLIAALAFRLLPPGVPGEWEWMRLPDWAKLRSDGLTIASAGVAVYAAFVALGLRTLSVKRSHLFEAASLIGLLFASVCIQVIVPMGAPAGYDLTKWASVNYFSGSSGYFQIARQKAAVDPWKFLADYPDWIRTQDNLHIGTHPPGLIVAQCLLLRAMDQNPRVRAMLLDHMPPSVDAGFRVFTNPGDQPLTAAERAALYATALLTLLACAGTVVPLYLLARAALPAHTSWTAAALLPLVPCANMFQPVADTAYPLLSTTALALAVWSVKSALGDHRNIATRLLPAFASGAVMAFGMAFTLAFLPVGLIVAMTIITHTSAPPRMRALLILATGAGFLSVLAGGWLFSSANPFVIASWNLKHHAQFYVEYPRRYWMWIWVNPVEMTIAVGLPTVVWCLLGYSNWRVVPDSCWSTLLVLALVNLTGRNMGEVARLWMLFVPPLLLAAGIGIGRLGARPATLAATTALLGAQTLALQGLIQVVSPV